MMNARRYRSEGFEESQTDVGTVDDPMELIYWEINRVSLGWYQTCCVLLEL